MMLFGQISPMKNECQSHNTGFKQVSFFVPGVTFLWFSEYIGKGRNFLLFIYGILCT
jgi:hypothetical protein